MFGLKRFEVGNFGNGVVPNFQPTEVTIDTIYKGVNKTEYVNEMKKEDNKKRLKTSKDIFDAINRRYNKFKSAYYNKGIKNMNKAKITRCYNKTKEFLDTLQFMHRKLLAANDPRAEKFGKKVEETSRIVQKYGAYVMRLNHNECKPFSSVKDISIQKSEGKIKRNSQKVRK